VLLFSKEETMIKFIERNKEIISTLSIVALVTVLSNSANAISDLDTKNNLSLEQAQTSETTSKEVFLVSKAKKLESFENKVSLTDLELKELLSLVGFKGKDLVVAWAVAKKESNGRPLAFNGNHKTGDSSYGMFQINMIDTLGPDRRTKFDLNSNAELFNPVKNAEIAYYMTSGGDDWSSWKGITPKTRMWMNKFPK
jgi:Lysozyme like domain